METSKYVLNEKKLRELYLDKKLKMSEVAKILKHSIPHIRNEMLRYGIDIKKPGYTKIKDKIIFSKEQYEFFDGLIASDGCLTSKLKNNALLSCSLKYYEFAKYISDVLKIGRVKEHWVKDIRFKKGGSQVFSIRSCNNILFTEERKRWYPNNKKCIPNDFKFSPISLNIWYLSDGTRSSFAKSRRCGLVLCTNAFDKNNIENTIIKFLNNIKIDCWIDKNNQVYIPRSNAKNFLDYIGNCPIECYKYKWIIEDKNFIDKRLKVGNNV